MEFSKAVSTFSFVDCVNVMLEFIVVGKYVNMNKLLIMFLFNYFDLIKIGVVVVMMIVGKTKMNVCVNALSDTSFVVFFNVFIGNLMFVMKNKVVMVYFFNFFDFYDFFVVLLNDFMMSRNFGDAFAYVVVFMFVKKKFFCNYVFIV